MSKQFFRGRIDKREDYAGFGFADQRPAQLGTQNSPMTLRVNSEERQREVEDLLAEKKLYANIELNEEAAEDISQLEVLLSETKPVVLEAKPKRNDPCSCGSEKKYKKCCGK